MLLDQRKYNTIVVTVTQSQNVPIPKDCNGYVAVNTGNTIFYVENFPLLPAPGPGLSGQSIGVAGNKDEIFVGNNGSLNVRVANPVGTNPVIYIVFKYYM